MLLNEFILCSCKFIDQVYATLFNWQNKTFSFGSGTAVYTLTRHNYLSWLRLTFHIQYILKSGIQLPHKMTFLLKKKNADEK